VSPEDVDGDCIVCIDKTVEPARVEWGHVFCYKCALREYMLSPLQDTAH
jgi:hypothetical protein